MLSSHSRGRSAGLVACSVLAAGSLSVVGGGPAAAAVQTTLYASPSGAGTTCSASTPCSLAQAQIKVRTLNAGMTGDILVLLKGGTYTLSSPFALTESSSVSDSGKNGFNVIYRNAPGEVPVLSGATTVSGWTLFDASKSIYRAPVGTAVSRQLWVGGIRAVRARTPLSPAGFTETATGFTSPGTTWLGLARPTDLEFSGRAAYMNHRCHVSSITGTTSATITMVQPCFGNSKTFAGFGAVAWVENQYSLLDAAGEFYLDTSTTPHYLFYKPRAGETLTGASPTPALLGTAQTLLTATGTAATPLSNVELTGLTFAYTTWNDPDGADGYATEGAGLRYVGSGALLADNSNNYVKTPAAVVLSRVTNVRVQRDVFRDLGAAGLDIANASQDVTVQGSTFTNLSAGGISVSGTAVSDHHPTPSTLRTLRVTIDNNRIDGIGQEFEDAVGIFLGFTDTSTISHNEIANLPYTGIWDGMGFGRMDVGGAYGWTTASTQQNQTIVANDVHDVMRTLEDGATVYTQNDSPNSIISANYLHNANSNPSSLQGGPYLDEQSSYWTVSGNVMRSLPSWVTFQSNSTGNTVGGPGNWTDTATANLYCGQCTTSTFVSDDITISNGSVPAGAQSVIDDAGLQPAYRDLLAPVSYGWDDISGTTAAVDGVHSTIDFGAAAWKGSNPGTGYTGLTRYGYFASTGTSRTFRIPAGRVLSSIVLAGTGTYTVSDTLDTVTGSLTGNAATTVTTGWTRSSPTITVTISTGFNSVVGAITTRPATQSVTYGFDDLTGAVGQAVNGYHAGIDFGTAEWQTDPPNSAFSLPRYAYFGGTGTTRSFRLPAGSTLTQIDLAGTGTYSISDGVNPTRSGSLAGNLTTTRVTTAWTSVAGTITVTLSTGYNSVVDNIVYSRA